MMKKIIVIDNIVNELEQLHIKKHLFEDTKWTFIEDVSLKDNLHQRRPGFKIMFDDVHPLSSYFETIINNTAKKIKLKNPELLEARSFLQLPLNKKYLGEGVDTPHLDRTEPHLVFLYYVGDSDGDTIIYNYRSKDKNDIPFFEDVKELKRITPKQGRVVVFDGLHWHTAEQPTKDVRCIINFNISNNGT
jgi:hypothetical protein